MRRESLSKAGKLGGTAPKHKWTDAERDIVRRDYNGMNQSADDIAQRLGVTRCAVKGQVQKLGLAMQKSPPWTPKELELLAEFIHRYSVIGVARRLHRSPNSVKVKATRLKLQLRARDDWFTKKEASEILGVGHKKVQFWIDNGALIATWHNGTKPQKNGMAMWHIELKDLRKFIVNHSEELLGRNVDIQQIVWIVANEAPTVRGASRKGEDDGESKN